MRRTATFALAVAVGLSGLTVLAGTGAAAGPAGDVPTVQGAEAPAGDPASDRALRRLRADADGTLRVHRGRAGDVDFVGTAADDTIDNPVRSPRVGPVAAAREDLARYGAALGVDRPDRELVLDGRAASASGGAVVRFDQTVSGLPVVGGQVVVTLDDAGGLTSIQATTSAADTADAARVGRAAAAATARRVTARAHRLAPGAVSVTGGELSVFDPAVLGAEAAFPPGAARTVRGFTAAHGVDVRETVLVDAVSGRVLLHVNDVQHALDREVCDRENHGGDESPCVKGVRSEGDPPTSVADVDSAYDLTGEVSRMYADIGDLDLTELIGRGAAGSRTLASTVRFCDVPDPNRTCTYDNAFWNGEQMFYGAGYAGADDVVGHEITHGVIAHYANLFYFFQSGAINESLADVMGEVLDHRRARPGEQASVWTIGEDLPLGDPLRNLARPTQFGQPDRMTSSLYDSDPTLEDSGGVHTNSGVGNKTAYLVSQGGTFNGVTVQGIDAGDPDLTKTATLYLQVIQSLSSGGDYADLGRVLVQSCADLAGAGTVGFTTADCTQVAAAVRATELAKQPPAAATPADAGRRCPAGTIRTVLFDDEHAPAAEEMTAQTLWTRAPRASFRGAVVEENATSGSGSWFALDPAPELDDPTRSSLSLSDALRIRSGVKTYLRFQHWYAFDYDPSVEPADYYDGGVVLVDDVSDSAGAQQTAGLPWVNGPTRSVRGTGTPTKGFGGLSNGWYASRVDLSSYAGRTVRPQFQVRGDREFAVLGWYLDDVEVYSCDPVLPTAARGVAVAGGIQSATLSWSTPAYAAQGISGYRVARRGSAATVLDAGARSAAFGALQPGVAHTFTVTPLGSAGAGPTTSVTALGTRFTYSVAPTGTSSTRIAGRLLNSSSRGVAGRPVVVQRQDADGTFRTLRTVTTSSTGAFGVTVAGRSKAAYRLVFRGADRLIGSRSGTRHL